MQNLNKNNKKNTILALSAFGLATVLSIGGLNATGAAELSEPNADVAFDGVIAQEFSVNADSLPNTNDVDANDDAATLDVAAFSMELFGGANISDVVDVSAEVSTLVSENSDENMVSLMTAGLDRASEIIAEVNTPKEITVLGIGDSLMVGATPFMQEIFEGAVIDARVGRPILEGLAILNGFVADTDNYTQNYLIIGLATNAKVSMDNYETILSQMTDNQTLVLVNGWSSKTSVKEVTDFNNSIIAEFAANHAGRVLVADWYSIADNNPNFIEPDGIHPNRAGQQAYAEMLQSVIEASR